MTIAICVFTIAATVAIWALLVWALVVSLIDRRRRQRVDLSGYDKDFSKAMPWLTDPELRAPVIRGIDWPDPPDEAA